MDEKHELLGKFEKFSQISKIFLQKIAKMHYFSIFFKKFNKPCVNFSRVWTKNTNCWENLTNFRKFFIKIQWENWIVNAFGKVVAKNRAFGNNIIFLQQFFSISGWRGTFPMFPYSGGAYGYIIEWHNISQISYTKSRCSTLDFLSFILDFYIWLASERGG